MPAILVNGVPEAERAPQSLANQDACRVLGNPGKSGPHVYLAFRPSLPLPA